MKTHEYTAALRWTGNQGTGTSAYRAYKRNWDLAIPGKPVVHCSNDPLLGGDPTLHNPEDLLVSALSACHMLWYLHLCANEKIIVETYEDHPVGIGELEPSGAGRFVSVNLKPVITLRTPNQENEREQLLVRAREIHGEIHGVCFIARSVNFPVFHHPEISFA